MGSWPRRVPGGVPGKCFLETTESRPDPMLARGRVLDWPDSRFWNWELGTGNGVGTGTEPGIRFVYPVALPPVRVLGKIVIKWRGCISAVHVPYPIVDIRV